MSSCICSAPVRVPVQYVPSFKVDLHLHEWHWPSTSQDSDVMIDTMALCCQLDILCKKELSQSSFRRIDHGKVSKSFDTKAMVLLDRMKSFISRLPPPSPAIEDYLDYTGLSRVYPRAAAYATRPDDLSLSLKKTHSDEYFPLLGSINQIINMSHQLNSDVTNSSNHKYIAHQLALLYQSLTAMSTVSLLVDFKARIEAGFKEIKEALSNSEDSPQLADNQKKWLLELTSQLVSTLSVFPGEATKELFPVAKLLQDT